MSYIDVKQAKAHLLACLAKYPSSFSFGLMSAVHEICALPTADVVEVVRCKDCAYYREENGYCMNSHCASSFYGHRVKEEHYCSYGERRTE